MTGGRYHPSLYPLALSINLSINGASADVLSHSPTYQLSPSYILSSLEDTPFEVESDPACYDLTLRIRRGYVGLPALFLITQVYQPHAAKLIFGLTSTNSIIVVMLRIIYAFLHLYNSFNLPVITSTTSGKSGPTATQV